MDVSSWKRNVKSLEDSLRKTESAARTASQTGTMGNRKKEFRNKVASIRDNDLKGLSKTLDQYRLNPRMYDLNSQEVTQMTNQLDNLRSTLSQIETICNSSDNPRTKLLSDSNQTRRKAVEESDVTVNLTSQDMLQEHLLNQDEEDEALNSISIGLSQLKQIGLTHNKEFHRQDQLLDELHDATDTTQSKLNQNIISVDKVDKSSSGGWCAMFIMALLLALIVSVIFSDWMCHILPGAKNCKSKPAPAPKP